MSSGADAPTRETAANEGKIDDLTRQLGTEELLDQVMAVVREYDGMLRVEHLRKVIAEHLVRANSRSYQAGVEAHRKAVNDALGR